MDERLRFVRGALCRTGSPSSSSRRARRIPTGARASCSLTSSPLCMRMYVQPLSVPAQDRRSPTERAATATAHSSHQTYILGPSTRRLCSIDKHWS